MTTRKKLYAWKTKLLWRLHGSAGPRVLHGSHHKVGTKWTEDILRAVSEEFGWTFQSCRQHELHWSTDVFMQAHSAFDLTLFGEFRGSHIIRDPRDVVISGYHYHLHSSEEWLRRPRDEYDGRSYQEHLNTLDYHDGMKAEMLRCSGRTVRDMLAWDYSDQRFFEFKYEDALGQPEDVFGRLFAHYRLSPEDISRAVELALEHTLAGPSDRLQSVHIRDGRSEQWRTVYDQRLRTAYDEILGDAHTRLGYEDW